MDELIESGENLRARKPRDNVHIPRRHKRQKMSKRPRPGSEESLQIGLRCKGAESLGAYKLLPQKLRTKVCAFCGREKALYKCRSCLQHLCLKVPLQSSGRKYPSNGPVCFQRFHGMNNYK